MSRKLAQRKKYAKKLIGKLIHVQPTSPDLEGRIKPGRCIDVEVTPELYSFECEGGRSVVVGKLNYIRVVPD